MAAPTALKSNLAMTQQAIDAFGALIGKRIPWLKRKPGTGHHADPEAAKSVGLRGPVAFSLHYYAQVSHMLAEHYGRRWMDTGELAVSFIKPVCAGDDLRIRIGERPVQRPLPVGDGRVVMQVDVYNQLDELVAAGSASISQ